MRINLNGELSNSNSVTANVSAQTRDNALGALMSSADTPGAGIDGIIGETIFFTSVLSPEQVKEIYRKTYRS